MTKSSKLPWGMGRWIMATGLKLHVRSLVIRATCWRWIFYGLSERIIDILILHYSLIHGRRLLLDWEAGIRFIIKKTFLMRQGIGGVYSTKFAVDPLRHLNCCIIYAFWWLRLNELTGERLLECFICAKTVWISCPNLGHSLINQWMLVFVFLWDYLISF
jgi:hypothetical protein